MKHASIASNLFKIPFKPSFTFREKKIKRFFFKLLFSKEERDSLDREFEKLAASKTANCWQELIFHYNNNKLEKFQVQAKKNLDSEKIIWQYWAQGIENKNLPNVVKLGFNSIDRYKGSYKVIRLDDSNIQEYIDLPDFVWKKKGVNGYKHAFFSDLLRLALLDAYGGIWIDATIMLTHNIPDKIIGQEFFMFQRDPDAKYKQQWINYDPIYFGWGFQHKINVLNSFIVASKGNKSIHLCLDLLLNYWKTQDSVYFYYFFQVLFNELFSDNLASMKGIIIDDTLPHIIQSKLQSEFSEKEFQRIVNISSIHKLTYQKIVSKNSLFERLLDVYNVQEPYNK